MVHYNGWNRKWDEWVTADRMLEKNEENLEKQRQMVIDEKKRKAAGKGKGRASTSGGGKKRKTDGSGAGAGAGAGAGGGAGDDSDSEDDSGAMERQVRLNLDMPLKRQLVNDWEAIQQARRLVKLPRSTTVSSVLADYVSENTKSGRHRKVSAAEAEKQRKKDEVIAEVTKGIKTYFERALDSILLYRFERAQYDSVKATMSGQSVADIYGPEHLLRLFVKLPGLLALTGLKKDEMALLQARLQHFLKFLSARVSTYYNAGDSYEAAPEDYVAAFKRSA